MPWPSSSANCTVRWTRSFELREEIRENISFLDACALDITLLDKEEKQLAAQLQEVLFRPAPPSAAKPPGDFARQLEEELRQLGFSEQVRVIPDFMPQEVWPGLMDEKGAHPLGPQSRPGSPAPGQGSLRAASFPASCSPL